MADVGLPLARAVVAHRRGAYGDAVDHCLPVRHRVRRIGASHAQRDLFHQLLIDSAWRGRRFTRSARAARRAARVAAEQSLGPQARIAR